MKNETVNLTKVTISQGFILWTNKLFYMFTLPIHFLLKSPLPLENPILLYLKHCFPSWKTFFSIRSLEKNKFQFEFSAATVRKGVFFVYLHLLLCVLNKIWGNTSSVNLEGVTLHKLIPFGNVIRSLGEALLIRRICRKEELLNDDTWQYFRNAVSRMTAICRLKNNAVNLKLTFHPTLSWIVHLIWS